MEELERTVKKQEADIERLKKQLESFERTFTTIKCRDCLFRTDDVLKMQEHAETLEHLDYCFMRGGKVVVDWVHFETKRKEPEIS